MTTNGAPEAATTSHATTIVVGLDGSAASGRALEWCARHARALGATKVVVVHAVHLPHYAPFAELGPVLTVPVMSACERQRIRALVTDEWCRPLRDAEIAHKVMLLEGTMPIVLRHVVTEERAGLVVTARGSVLGATEVATTGVAEELAAWLECPLVTIP